MIPKWTKPRRRNLRSLILGLLLAAVAPALPATPAALPKPLAASPRPAPVSTQPPGVPGQPIATDRPEAKPTPPAAQAQRASEPDRAGEVGVFPPPLQSYRERTLIAAYGQIAEAIRRSTGNKNTAESRRDQAALARIREALQALSRQQREKAWEALEEAHRANAASPDVRTLVEDLSHFLRAAPAR